MIALAAMTVILLGVEEFMIPPSEIQSIMTPIGAAAQATQSLYLSGMRYYYGEDTPGRDRCLDPPFTQETLTAQNGPSRIEKAFVELHQFIHCTFASETELYNGDWDRTISDTLGAVLCGIRETSFSFFERLFFTPLWYVRNWRVLRYQVLDAFERLRYIIDNGVPRPVLVATCEFVPPKGYHHRILRAVFGATIIYLTLSLAKTLVQVYLSYQAAVIRVTIRASSVSYRAVMLALFTLATWTVFGRSNAALERRFHDLLTLVAGPANRLPIGMRSKRLAPFFRTAIFNKGNVRSGTHVHATAERNGQTKYAERLATACGLTLWSYQMSKADMHDNTRQGVRSHYDDKDLTVPHRNDPLPDMPLISLVDVDYYVDMPNFLACHPRPTLLYTIQPEAVAGRVDNGAFKFTDNVFEMVMQGACKYKHRIWNYNHDSLRVTSGNWFWPTLVTYAVERHRLSDHRQQVFLMPTAVYTGVVAWLMLRLTGNDLERLDVTTPCGTYNVLKVVGGDPNDPIADIRVSVGDNGADASVEMSQEVYATLVAAANTSTRAISPSTICTHLGDSTSAKNDAQLVTGYFRSLANPKIPVVFSSEESIRHYVRAKNVDDKMKISLHAYMSPLVGCLPYAPYKCKQNDEACVRTRLTNIQHKKPVVQTDFVSATIKEFIDHMVKDNGRNKLRPVTANEVYDNMPRPAQQASLEEAEWTGPEYSRLIKAFQKAEAYPDAKDPRNISTICPEDKMQYSKYTYALASRIKQHVWYAFGKTPRAIADHVAGLCSRSTRVALGDFSRMDGRVSNIGRELTNAWIAAEFTEDEVEAALAAAKTQIDCNARTSNGVSYKTGWSRLSGSPETSLFNTLENVFVAFLSFRIIGLSPDASWKKLNDAGFGGDDSIMGDTDIQAYSKAAAMIGHKATGETIEREGSGVNFLARYYSPAVWHGDNNSVSDPRRLLSKFHTTTKPVSTLTQAKEKLKEKCLSIAFTDFGSPLIGEFARKALFLLGTRVPNSLAEHTADTSWWARFDHEDTYPNDVGDWATDLLCDQIPSLLLDDALAFIDEADTVEALMSAQLFSEVEHDVKATDTEETVTIDEVTTEPPTGLACRLCGSSEHTVCPRQKNLRPCCHCKDKNPDHTSGFCKANKKNREWAACFYCKHPHPSHVGRHCMQKPKSDGDETPSQNSSRTERSSDSGTPTTSISGSEPPSPVGNTDRTLGTVISTTSVGREPPPQPVGLSPPASDVEEEEKKNRRGPARRTPMSALEKGL